MKPITFPAKTLYYGLPAALSALVLTTGCSPKPTPAAEVIRPVQTTIVSTEGENNVRSFSGLVEAAKQVELAFQVPGVLTSLTVREGQTVKKGDVLAQLRRDEFQARLDALKGQLDRARSDLQAARAGVRPEERLRLESNVRSARASLVNARTEQSRARQLLQSRTISRVEFDRADTAYSVAQENYKAAQQTLEQGSIGREEDIQAREAEVRGFEGRVVEASIQLEDTSLQAPYDGVIAQRFVEQGQNIRAQQPIIKFQDVNEIDIVVDIPEVVMAANLRAADIVNIVAAFSAAPGLQFPVYIKEIAQRADPVTQTFRIRAAMKAPTDVNLLPGMTATVTLTYRRASVLGNRILVPVTAVSQQSSSEQVVWVIAEDGIVSRRLVKTGAVTGSSIEIIEGVEPGERIAVAGVSFLSEGMKVRDLGNGLESNRL